METSTSEIRSTPKSPEVDQIMEGVKTDIESETGREIQSMEKLSESSFKKIFLAEDKEGRKFSVYLYSGRQNSEIQLAINNSNKSETILKSNKDINIPKVYDNDFITLSEQGNRGFYIVKEYLEGQPLPDNISDLATLSDQASELSQVERIAEKSLKELEDMVRPEELKKVEENAKRTASQLFPDESFEQLDEETKNNLLIGEIKALLDDKTFVNIEDRQKRVNELKTKVWSKLREAGEQLSQLHDLGLSFGDFKLDNVFVSDEDIYFLDLDTISDQSDTQDSDLSRKVATPHVNLEPGLYTQETQAAVRLLRELRRDFSEKLQEGVETAVKYIENSRALQSDYLSGRFKQDFKTQLEKTSSGENEPMLARSKLERLCYDYLFSLKRGRDYQSEEAKDFFNNPKRDIRSYSVSIFDLITKVLGAENYGPAPAVSLADLGLSQRGEEDGWHFGVTEEKAQELSFGLLHEYGEVPEQALRALFVSSDLEQIEEVRPRLDAVVDGFESWLEVLAQDEGAVKNTIIVMNLIGNKEKLSKVMDQIIKQDSDRGYPYELRSTLEDLGLKVEGDAELKQEVEEIMNKGKNIISANNREDEK
ncbi:MAG: hypothetical protein ABEJ02_01250 [Candidatus Paceibacteria bacterium]